MLHHTSSCQYDPNTSYREIANQTMLCLQAETIIYRSCSAQNLHRKKETRISTKLHTPSPIIHKQRTHYTFNYVGVIIMMEPWFSLCEFWQG
jgi:hypothetical protein